MNLIQLLYCSKSVADINEDDEASILKTSRYNNSNNNVTGALMNNGSYFIPILEGNYR